MVPCECQKVVKTITESGCIDMFTARTPYIRYVVKTLITDERLSFDY